jgi:tetratricopeptide (TPR) repeat protein
MTVLNKDEKLGSYGIPRALYILGCLCTVMAVAPLVMASPSEQVWNVYNNGNKAKAALEGLEALKNAPDDPALLEVTGYALEQCDQFEDALPLLKRAVQLDRDHSWISAWSLAYTGYAYYGLGEYGKARTALDSSLQLHATSNVVVYAESAERLLGLSDIFTNWATVETSHFRFHFSPEAANLKASGFTQERERSFKIINRFFHAKLPKKIDSFIWRSRDDGGQPELCKVGFMRIGRTGFARSDLTLTQEYFPQTGGHEMTHVLCVHAFKPIRFSGLVDEGIAVYFDQSGRNRLKTAQRAVRAAKLSGISMDDLWVNFWSKTNEPTYAIAGAFIERLRNKGGEAKLKDLLHEQTIEAAFRIYGPELATWITEFEQDLQAEDHTPRVGRWRTKIWK